MNFRIGTVLPSIVTALALMGIVSAGLAAYQAFDRRQRSSDFLKFNQISQLLLRSAGQWAVERGLTNAPLRSTEVAAAERREEIAKARSIADQAFQEALQQIRALQTMKGVQKSVADAEQALQAFDRFRREVDANLAKPGSERSPEVVERFATDITNLIDVGGNRLRLTLETMTTPPTAALSQLVALRHLAAQMAENAGRERAFFGGIVSARDRLSIEGIRYVARHRGQVELAWQTILPVSQRSDVSPRIADAIAAVKREYFEVYDEVRNGVFASGEAGQYKITGSDYVARATRAIDSILKLADVIGGAADQEAAADAAKTTSDLIIGGAVLLAGIFLAALSFWVTFSRILRPLSALKNAMGELAQGNFAIVLPGLSRGDEVGDMARAVEAFKVKAEQRARDEAEEKAKRDRVGAEQRRTEMMKLADAFESAIGQIVETVSSASTELEASAATLKSTASRSQDLTTMVAAASGEASTNVQSVASATEELASSVNEISRQVQQSARMANEAVGQARRTNERVEQLSRAAARIGDVIELINTIAGQTNLLALNATIEAARAGEAGRGFAVVASEVKALAEQTAKATGEIGQQISGIQSATQESVVAIGEIGGVIEKLSEISSTIAAAVEEQGAATQEISRNVQQAAQGTMQVSSNVEHVQRGASETGSASSQVLSSAQMLSRDSARLKTEVDKFLATVRAA